jgi:hypothetical protein
MALSATATLKLRFTAQQENDMDFGGSVGIERMDEVRGPTFASGTAANQINVFWEDQRTVVQGGTETINIHDGAVEKNGIGNVVAMDILKAIYIKNTSTALTLSLNGAAAMVPFTSANTETIDLLPGCEFFMSNPGTAGWAMGTNKSIKITISGGSGSCVYDIAMWGVTS